MKSPKPLGQYLPLLWSLPRSTWLKLLTGLLLAMGSLFIFAEIVDEIFEQETQVWDQWAFELLHRWDPEWLAPVMFWFTKSGSAPSMLSLSLAVVLWLGLIRRNLRAITLFALASLGGLGLNLLLKYIFRRSRPLLEGSIDSGLDAQGWSLPSGHAMTAMIFYGFVGYLVIRSQRRLWSKILFSAILVTFVLMIGLSRIYFNVHYLSDVIAGFAAGCFWLTACILAMEFRPWYHKHFIEPAGHLPGDAIADNITHEPIK